MLALRKVAPVHSNLFRGKFATLRPHLIEIAVHGVESAARIRISLPDACQDAVLFRHLAGRFAVAGPEPRRVVVAPNSSVKPSTKQVETQFKVEQRQHAP